jgi:hypothetical protein
MADQQRALTGSADLAAVDAAITELAVLELTRGAAHAGQLRSVLALAAAQHTAGMDLATAAQLALALGCSQARAARLLTEAQALVVLPGALEAVECGLLTVEQSSTLVNQLAVLDPAGQLAVWQRLQQRLIDDNSHLPPARLTELLRRWVIAHDREAAQERRRQAEQSRNVDYRRRDDGLYDLTGAGLNPPDTRAILSRIAERARPWGVDDDRTADQRRLDAFRDLLLGRDQQPIQPNDQPMLDGHDCDCGAGQDASHERGSCRRCALRAAGAAPCGCLPGQPVPCGADTAVLLPIGAGLGSTDELAELAGHGPLEPDLTAQLLLAGPVLRPVWVDADGVVVAAGDTTIRPQRGDPTAVRAALLALQDLPPPPPQPRHPLDHPPEQPPEQPPDQPSPGQQTVDQLPAVPTELAPVGALHPPDLPTTAPAAAAPRVLAGERVLADAMLGGSGEHPAGTPGSYRPSRRLRRLIELRAPRCEWPGCGARALRCDSEHDLAWPTGPTCACNLGPCCRRHHRIKQLGWTKTRGPRGVVTWTDPTGRSWTSPGQHQPPQPPRRPPLPIPTAHPLAELSALQREEELWHDGLLPADTGPFSTPADAAPADDEPADSDRLRHRLLHTDTRWTLDLANPHPWQVDPV